MKQHPSHRPGRRGIAVFAALLLVVFGTLVGVAAATTGSGTVTAETVADGVVAGRVHIGGAVALKTKGPMRVLEVKNTNGSLDFSSGWHAHSGPIVVVITQGAMLLRSSRDCAGTTYMAGEAFVEETGVIYLASNAGPGPLNWTTTQLIPAGSPTRIDKPDPCLGHGNDDGHGGDE